MLLSYSLGVFGSTGIELVTKSAIFQFQHPPPLRRVAGWFAPDGLWLKTGC